MLAYRVYQVGEDNHFVSAEVVACADDEAALAEAAKLVTDRLAAEVWCEARMVGQVPAQLASRLTAAGR